MRRGNCYVTCENDEHDWRLPRIHYGKGCCSYHYDKARSPMHDDYLTGLFRLASAIAKRRRMWCAGGGVTFQHVVDRRYPRRSIYFVWHGPGSRSCQ